MPNSRPKKQRSSAHNRQRSVLFLYRPRQTWMPYRPPRRPTEQDLYNRQLQARYDATRRVAAPAIITTVESSAPRDDLSTLEALGRLHDSGVLTDEEFA